jgi:hypothetical protein
MTTRKSVYSDIKTHPDEFLIEKDQREESPQRRKSRGSQVVSILIAVLVVAAGAGAYYFYWYVSPVAAGQDKQGEREVQSLVSEVGELMLLPTDEVPTVATVADKTKVQDQLFFKNTENGDKLLAYTRSMQAVLYRPAAHKIIAVAPIVVSPAGERSSE